MIPSTEQEVLSELLRVQKSVETLRSGMAQLEADPRYSVKERSEAGAIKQFCEANGNILHNAIAGLSKIALAKKSSSNTTAIIDKLIEK